jgi:hypothetical protein
MSMRQMTRSLPLACGLMLLCAHPLFAQIGGLGVKGGVNLATIRNSGDGSDEPAMKSLAGLVAGVFATLPLVSWLELQPEALYSMKGARLDFEGVNGSVLLDYLEVPVLTRYSRRGTGPSGYYVAGGPAAAFRLRARTRTKFGGATEEIDIADDVERLDFGVAIGGGFEHGSLVIDGRYTHGLKDIDKDKTDGITTKNRALSITFGVKF